MWCASVISWLARPRWASRLRADLTSALGDVAIVGDVRGLGMMIGIELVRDPETKEPFPRADRVTERVLAAARDAGLLLYCLHRPRRRT